MKWYIWVVIVIVSLALAGCKRVVSIAGLPVSPKTWIDAPLNGSTLALEPYSVIFHGTDTENDVSEFEIIINSSVVAAGAPTSNNGSLFYGNYLWIPQAPGTFVIEVRSKNSQGVFGPKAQAVVTIPAEREQTNTPTATPTERVVAEVHTATPTPEDSSCTVTAIERVFCRPGPGYEYDDLFDKEQSSDVFGITSDGAYLLVAAPNIELRCTVPNDPALVTLSGGSCDALPEFKLPPPPTATATNTPLPDEGSSADPPTETPRPPQCSDGIDNDGDGRIDTADRECRDASDNDEANR